MSEAEMKAQLLELVEASRTTYAAVTEKLQEFDTRLVALEVLVDMLFTGPEDQEDQAPHREN